MKSLHIMQTLAIATLLIAPFALQANLLGPGGSVPPDVLTVGADLFPPVVGANATLLASTGVQASTIGTSGVQADYIENVYRDPIANAACPLGGCLDFVIAVSNIGADIIEHVTTSSFAGVTTDVGVQGVGAGCAAALANPTCIISDLGDVLQPFTPAGGGSQVTPSAVSRSVGAGSVISFDFTTLGAINPGSVSDLLVIQTNATGFITGSLGFIDGSGASGTGFAPSPEPRLVSFALVGLLGLVAFFVRRRKAQVAE